ncbi:MAG: MFS transporter [Calditrichaeota bacterium]|nr:MFS transporter [Calditrichota bacterium]
MIRFLIYLLFFLSGAAGLIYQLIWVRKLILVFGNTTYATSSILTAFMGGLALGSYLFGKYADRIKKPLKAYGYLEAGIGISAIGILFLFLPISDSLYIWAFNTFGNQAIIFNSIRFLFAIIILIIPTTLMGGTLPIISKYFIANSEDFGKRLSRLYGFNTLGAVVGAFFTGFFLIRWLGVTSSFWIAIFINLCVAGAALLLSAQKTKTVQSAKQQAKSGKKTSTAEARNQKISSYSSAATKIIISLFALSGFAALAYEVIWTRALIFFVSSTTYSFTIILVTFLVGISLGSLIVSKWIDRMKHLALWFALFEVVIAFFAILSIPLFMNLNSFQIFILGMINSNNWTQVSVLLFLSASFILLIPTICMGAVFPIVNRIYVENVKTLGKGVGNVYMANTVGAILGSFLSGFVILPLIGLNGSILFLALVNFAIGLSAIFIEKDFKTSRNRYLAFVTISTLLFVVISLMSFTSKPLFLKTAGFQNTRLLYQNDTASATISVLEKKDQINIWGKNVRYLNVNGHNTAHTTFSDMVIHKMLAHLPMLLHPAPEKALVIGFGFGNTCQSFLQYDMIKRVDCVELVADEKVTARYFQTHNKGVFDDPRFKFIVNDGRNYVLATKKKYDIISVNSVDPKFSPTLYTEEFYKLCYKKLNENGQLVAWLPIYGMNLEEIQALTQSFIKVFPNSNLWYNNPEHLLLLGFKGVYPFDIKTISERMNLPNVKSSLAEIHLDNVYSFLSTFYCGKRMLEKFSDDAPSHSDNYPLVEFSQVPTKEMIPQVYEKLAESRESILPYCVGFGSLGDAESVRAKLADFEKQAKNMMTALFTYRLYGQNPAYKEVADKAIEKMRKSIDKEEENTFNLVSFVDLVNHEDLTRDKKYFARVLKTAPEFAKAYVFMGLEAVAHADWPRALEFYEKALEINSNYPTALMSQSFVFIKTQKWEKARESLTRVIELEPENPFAHSSISQVYYMMHDYSAAILHAKMAIENFPIDANLYFNLGMMYQKNKQIPEAIAAFEEGIKIDPYDSRAIKKLDELKKMK